jgi:hypothetical protein
MWVASSSRPTRISAAPRHVGGAAADFVLYPDAADRRREIVEGSNAGSAFEYPNWARTLTKSCIRFIPFPRCACPYRESLNRREGGALPDARAVLNRRKSSDFAEAW